jgi:FG-GAP repeat
MTLSARLLTGVSFANLSASSSSSGSSFFRLKKLARWMPTIGVIFGVLLLSAGSFGQGPQPATFYGDRIFDSTGVFGNEAGTTGAAVGDFNGDGIPDLAV